MTPLPLKDREDELLGDELVLSKIDAAREQLHTAIELFFSNASHVSQHTLIGAAHGILRGVATSQGLKVSFKDSNLISENQKGAYIKAVHTAQNFFKHADTDAKDRIAFRYKLNPLMLLDAVFLWIRLGEPLTHQIKVFLVWSQLYFPDLICMPAAELELKKVRASAETSEEFMLIGRALLRDA